MKLFPPHQSKNEMMAYFATVKNIKELPSYSFPPHWEVTIVPPFGDALWRFLISTPASARKISVCLNASNALGFDGEPYIEIFPNAEGTRQRFSLRARGMMFKAVEEALLYYTPAPLRLFSPPADHESSKASTLLWLASILKRLRYQFSNGFPAEAEVPEQTNLILNELETGVHANEFQKSLAHLELSVLHLNTIIAAYKTQEPE